jgi:hypothetical protein
MGHNRWVQGWQIAAPTPFSTGLPVTLIDYADNSLLGLS